jgi:HEPN domain-containing protein
MLDTAAQRPATGLDEGARRLIIEAVASVVPVATDRVVGKFFTDRYGGFNDYYAAVEAVWGYAQRRELEDVVTEAEARAEFHLMDGPRIPPKVAASVALLAGMPEPDFRLAVEEFVTSIAGLGRKLAERLTRICRMRGAPWAFDPTDGWQWVGDELVEMTILRPALSAIEDPRFAGGVRSEFESARNELRTGTPVARKQAVYESGASVESAMKVLLTEHGEQFPETDTAQRLFERLVAVGIVPKYMERMVLSAATPRNKKAGHGAGAVAHDVSAEDAEAIVAAAAGAIRYLHDRLP